MSFSPPRIIAPALLSVCLLIGACSESPEKVSAAQSKPAKPGAKLAPEFALKDSDGRTVKLSDYKLDQWRLMHIGAQPVPPALIKH